MSTATSIEWTDATWNPVTGCTKVSPGCEHCYIERQAPLRMAGRGFDRHGIGATTGVVLHPERLDVPARWRKPRRVFVCSMADLFHVDVPDAHIVQVFAAMAISQRHTFQVLTKRHNRMRALLTSDDFSALVAAAAEALWESDGWHHSAPAQWPGWPLPNVWLGVSTENQQWANARIPVLLDTPAAVRWTSAEPLLGLISLAKAGGIPTPLPVTGDVDTAPTLDWVVVGGESGPGSRPMNPLWARILRGQCHSAGIPFLFKQWGNWVPAPWRTDRDATDGATHAFTGGFWCDEHGYWVEDFMALDHKLRPTERDLTEPEGATGMRRVAKKIAGRELDGVVHNEFPGGKRRG